jgi:hypothetical protein
MRLWTGSAWVAAYVSGSGFIAATGGTMTGPLNFPDGSAASPSITNDGDANTGIFFPAADTIAFAEGGAEVARFDSSGNFGLGVTPSAWDSTYKAIQVGARSMFFGIGSEANMANNAYYNSGYKYVATSAAGLYTIDANVHKWYNAASGTAGNAISFTQAMTLTASNNLLLGTTTDPAYSGYTTLALNNATNGGLLDIQYNGTRVGSFQAGSATELRMYAGSGVASTFYAGGSERARIDTSGSLLIATTTAPTTGGFARSPLSIKQLNDTSYVSGIQIEANAEQSVLGIGYNGTTFQFGTSYRGTGSSKGISFSTSNVEAVRIDTSQNLLVGKTSNSFSTAGMTFTPGGLSELVASSSTVIAVNRLATDGDLIDFYQAGTKEGAISVSGTTVTYGGGHLARFGQLPDGSEDPTLLKGTVLTNLDEMCVWINKETGIPADNEQCNKVKISDVDGDANVAGVFVSWSYDEQHDTNDLFVAMTGDMIIRIAQGTTVQRGDLLMSAGDGTAKPQGDDIVRSKTVAKVTSTHVTCTYADGSYCVPCVLMAC